MLSFTKNRDQPRNRQVCLTTPIRTLRFHGLEPSVEALSVCSHKLGHYADKLRGSDKDTHKACVQSFDGLKALCDQAISKQAHQIWREPDRMRA